MKDEGLKVLMGTSDGTIDGFQLRLDLFWPTGEPTNCERDAFTFEA